MVAKTLSRPPSRRLPKEYMPKPTTSNAPRQEEKRKRHAPGSIRLRRFEMLGLLPNADLVIRYVYRKDCDDYHRGKVVTLSLSDNVTDLDQCRLVKLECRNFGWLIEIIRWTKDHGSRVYVRADQRKANRFVNLRRKERP